MKTLIAYSSETGNTEKIAKTIKDVCPFESDLFKINGNSVVNIFEYELFILGYWVENSKANNDATDFIKQIKNKNVVFFGTTGTDPKHPYIKSVLTKTEAGIDKSNTILGHFVCQGEIAKSVIDNFEILVNSQPENKMLSALLNIFKEQYPISIGHPNDLDLKSAKDYFQNIFNSLK
jgi:flavodoxin